MVELREDRISVRLKKTQMEKLKTQAKKMGMKLAQYIRFVLFEEKEI